MELKTEKKQSQAIKIIAVDGGKEIGRAFLYIIFNNLHKEPYGLMEDLFVEEAYRRQGIGTQLTKALIEEAKRQGCYKLIGTSRFANESVHKLYERLGFQKHGYEFRMELKGAKSEQEY